MLYLVCQLGARTHYAIVIQSTCVLTAISRQAGWINYIDGQDKVLKGEALFIK